VRHNFVRTNKNNGRKSSDRRARRSIVGPRTKVAPCWTACWRAAKPENSYCHEWRDGDGGLGQPGRRASRHALRHRALCRIMQR
jgi:hypothetical protein